MKLTEHIYKTSGVEYGTNSNTYVIDCGEYLVFLDGGFDEIQWSRIRENIRRWGLEGKPVTHAFITHGHFDHAGNISKLNEMGAAVIAADPDAGKIENGHPEMEQLFGRPWVLGRVDERPADGRVYSFDNNITVTAIAAPGHSEGSFAYVVEDGGVRALCTGDMFFVKPFPPEDKVETELAYMGGWDFSLEAFRKTLQHMGTLHCNLLLPGHYYVYYGDVDALCQSAWKQAMDL